MCDIGDMIPAITKIFDAFGKIFAGLQMAGSVYITLGPGVKEREVDHSTQHQRCCERMALFRGFGRRRQQFVVIAVQIALARQNKFGGAVMRGPIDQKAKRLIEIRVRGNKVQRLDFGIFVIKIGQ